MRRLWACGVAAIAALAIACRGDNELSGSVDQLFPLSVSWVEMLRNDHAFQVSYYANRAAEVDLVARVTVYVGDTGLDAGVTYPLEGEYAPGHPRTTVVHMASGEAQRVFPRVERGQLRLEEGGGANEPTSGWFGMLFETGDVYGSGRTLDGTFSGTPRDAGWD